MQGVKKENKKGRAKGEIWMGIRKELMGRKRGIEEERIMIREIDGREMNDRNDICRRRVKESAGENKDRQKRREGKKDG